LLRKFSLPDDADETAIEATHKDGGRSIRSPKTKTKTSTARQVKVA
jgi:HSP20 family molecular chaperone IbpA